MLVFKHGRVTLLTTFVAMAQFWAVSQLSAQAQPVSIFIVRHAEIDSSQTTVPLTAAGRQRAELLVHTFPDVKFTHIFATHTTRTRQMVDSTVRGAEAYVRPNGVQRPLYRKYRKYFQYSMWASI